MSIERKTADRYMGPFRIVRRTQGGSYVIEEMDGSELFEHLAAYRLIPYVQRKDLDFWAKIVGADDEDDTSQEPSDNGDSEPPQESSTESSSH